jgi:Secretion system C-terminal sorting domain
MLKLLLCAYGSLLSVTAAAQNVWIKPAELVLEDPAQAVYDFSQQYLNGPGRIVLSWKLRDELPDFFSVEKSDGGERYTVMAVMTRLTGRIFQWTDEAPLKGRNNYRIRYSFKEGKPRYSKTISVVVPGAADVRFYPNPVDQILIIRSDQMLDVFISDGAGRPRLTVQSVLGLKTINVSSLEKGVYILRFSNKLTNVISQERLIKN